MMHCFTTRAVSRSERSLQWRALTKAQQVEFDDDRQASLRGGDFGSLRLCVVSMGRHRVVQASPALERGIQPALKFLFQEEGVATIQQGGMRRELTAGQWCALRKDQPFIIESPAFSRQLAITAQAGAIALSGDDLDQPMSFLRGPAQILHAFASATVLAGSAISGDDRAEIGRQIAALAAMALRGRGAPQEPDARQGRRAAILDYVDRHLGEADLGVPMIAHAFGISTRSIHKLFEGEPHTLSRAIWDRRLERCREEIVDPAQSGRSITDIAHFWGFSDSQHFSRAFKLRYGVTPRDYRQLHALH